MAGGRAPAAELCYQLVFRDRAGNVATSEPVAVELKDCPRDRRER
jgi:hypothetical protein